MRLFRKRKDDPVDPNERSHVVHYSYAPSEDAGRAMRQEAESNGYLAAVREPLPDFPGRWAVICETDAVTSPDVVREADEFFEGLASRHGSEYDGWEASV